MSDESDFSPLDDELAFDRRHQSAHEDDPACLLPDCKTVFVLERRVSRHRAELNEIKSAIAQNAKDTSEAISLNAKATENALAQNSKDTAEVLSIIQAGKGFFKVTGWLARVAKPIILLVLIVAGVVTWFKTGTFPKLPE